MISPYPRLFLWISFFLSFLFFFAVYHLKVASSSVRDAADLLYVIRLSSRQSLWLTCASTFSTVCCCRSSEAELSFPSSVLCSEHCVTCFCHSLTSHSLLHTRTETLKLIHLARLYSPTVISLLKANFQEYSGYFHLYNRCNQNMLLMNG